MNTVTKAIKYQIMRLCVEFQLQLHVLKQVTQRHQPRDLKLRNPSKKKVQTLNFNTEYKHVQTLPIWAMHSSCQSAHIDITSVNTMNNLIEQQHQATLMPMSEEKHMQTFMVKVAAKAMGLCKRMTIANASLSEETCVSASKHKLYVNIVTSWGNRN